jgi:methylmalonyl-CoA/ethylmalonyl-CoA epimerase
MLLGSGGMQPTISHVGIAVRDVSAAARFYREVLGVSTRGPDISDGARIVHLDFGGAAVELLEPVEPDSPIARFLERRGPGIHHICYRVTDLDDAVRRCREQGYTLVDEAPRPGAGGRRVVFLHPKSTDGVLVELTE